MIPEAQKKCPLGLAARRGTTDTNHKNPSHEVLYRQVQKLPPQVPATLSIVASEPPDFICSRCWEPNPWSRMGGWDRRIKYCDDCVGLMDEIELSATGVFK